MPQPHNFRVRGCGFQPQCRSIVAGYPSHSMLRRYSGDDFSRLPNPLIYRHLLVEAAGIEPASGVRGKWFGRRGLRRKWRRGCLLASTLQSPRVLSCPLETSRVLETFGPESRSRRQSSRRAASRCVAARLSFRTLRGSLEEPQARCYGPDTTIK